MPELVPSNRCRHAPGHVQNEQPGSHAHARHGWVPLTRINGACCCSSTFAMHHRHLMICLRNAPQALDALTAPCITMHREWTRTCTTMSQACHKQCALARGRTWC
jgi:hypothetical protein